MGRQDESFDVIIVGFGCAGACAAISAAEAGARVLALDRDYGGGATKLSGGVVYAGGGTMVQAGAGVEDTPENMFAYLRQEVGNAVSEQLLRRFCESSVEQLEWLEAHGATYASSLLELKTSYPIDPYYLYYSGNERVWPYEERAKPAARGHRQIGKGMSSGHVFYNALRNAAIWAGAVLRPLSRVHELILEKGRVIGVRYRAMSPNGKDGKQHARVSRYAGKLGNWAPPIGGALSNAAERIWQRAAVPSEARAGAIILSAGGFAFNREMVHRYAPAYDNVTPLGTLGDDGTGIELGRSAGGATGQMDRMTAWRFLSPPVAFMEGVTVGPDGSRIAQEDLYGATLSERMVHKYGGKGFAILDSTSWNRARAQVREQTQTFQLLPDLYVLTIGHTKAHTLEALAQRLGISPRGLLATVEAYNQGILSGAGDPAHKSPELCQPLLNPPFYGFDISVDASPFYYAGGLTLGGLRTDDDTGAVIDENGKTIPGLYAAGRNAVGVCSSSYVGGLALADCVFSGRHAGEHAAREAIAPRVA